MTESVWDYPRPPRVEPCSATARVEHAGRVVADSSRAFRVLETNHPPGIYLPGADCDETLLVPSSTVTVCEFKGVASYVDLVVGDLLVADAAWVYREPRPGYEAIRDHYSFYPGRVDACYLDHELVTPQAGDFYGGWITSGVTGPFKGGAGTRGW
ncbi:MAG: DUF427 domain-containing protein [Acidimicrobiia bacterium]|nr:DUF427 domain-containing protein [Acidimicrobiia bacterium]